MAPDAILLAAGAAKAGSIGYSAVIDLFEHQASVHDLPSGLTAAEIADIYGALNAPSLRDLLKVTIAHRADGRPQLRLVTDRRVGFGASGRGANRLFVRVRPKIDTRRFLELAFLADVLPRFDFPTHTSAADFADVLRWTLELFLSTLEKTIASGGLRPTHERVTQVLRNRVRGKLQVPAFMASLAKGHPDRIPCQFSALVLDNSANRLLRWTLDAAAKMSRDLDDGGMVSARAALLERHFREVTLVRPSRAALKRETVLPPNQRHYADVVRVAKLLLTHFHVDASPGVVPSLSLSMNMHDVYERAFWKLLSKQVTDAQAKPKWRLGFSSIHDPRVGLSVELEPDVFVPASPGRYPLVVDTKWKNAVQPYQTESLVRPTTSDIYQVASYASTVLRDQHDIRKCVAVLLYPSLVECTTMEHRIVVGEFETLVLVAGWNVSRPPHEAVAELCSLFDALRVTDINDMAVPGDDVSTEGTVIGGA